MLSGPQLTRCGRFEGLILAFRVADIGVGSGHNAHPALLKGCTTRRLNQWATEPEAILARIPGRSSTSVARVN